MLPQFHMQQLGISPEDLYARASGPRPDIRAAYDQVMQDQPDPASFEGQLLALTQPGARLAGNPGHAMLAARYNAMGGPDTGTQPFKVGVRGGPSYQGDSLEAALAGAPGRTPQQPGVAELLQAQQRRMAGGPGPGWHINSPDALRSLAESPTIGYRGLPDAPAGAQGPGEVPFGTPGMPLSPPQLQKIQEDAPYVDAANRRAEQQRGLQQGARAGHADALRAAFMAAEAQAGHAARQAQASDPWGDFMRTREQPFFDQQSPVWQQMQDEEARRAAIRAAVERWWAAREAARMRDEGWLQASDLR